MKEFMAFPGKVPELQSDTTLNYKYMSSVQHQWANNITHPFDSRSSTCLVD